MRRMKNIPAILLVGAAMAGALVWWLGGAPTSQLATAAQRPVENLRMLSQAYIDVAKAMRPSVVNIATARKFEHPEVRTPQGTPFQDPFEEWFDRFFKDIPRRPNPRGQRGLGSGIIYSADGYIVTNAHVVDGADEIKVNLDDGRSLDAELKGIDKKSDVAVLKINADNLVPAQLGDSDQLQVGEIVMAIGSPFGLDQSVTSGIVSAKGRYGMGIEAYEDFIQTDAAINPGNSGGPLIDLDCRVIGINTAIYSRSGANQGIGFAIPINMAKNIIEQLIDTGEVTRGWLGVSIQEVTPDLAAEFKVPEGTRGVLVTEVYDNTPAAEAGLQPGDVIIGYDGSVMENLNQLRHNVANTRPGKSVELVIVRRGEKKMLAVKIARQTTEALAMATQPHQSRSSLGLSVQDLTADIAARLRIQETSGVIVTDVDPDGAAAQAGIQPGDIIKQVEETKVTSVAEFDRAVGAVKPGQDVLVLVKSRGVTKFVLIKTPKEE